LGILAGHYRYAHLAALRGDDIGPRLPGLRTIVSEDCVRRALRRIGPQEGRDWLGRHLDQTRHSFLDTTWVFDIGVTNKAIYGRQEGASIGYNTHKPGRSSRAYQAYWVATLRLCLDVEVQPGNQSAAGHRFTGLRMLNARLPVRRWSLSSTGFYG